MFCKFIKLKKPVHNPDVDRNSTDKFSQIVISNNDEKKKRKKKKEKHAGVVVVA